MPSRTDATIAMLNDPARISLNLLEEAGITKEERLHVIREAWDNAKAHLKAEKGMASKEGVVYVADNQAQARAREHIFGVNRIAFNGNHADSQPVVNVQVVVQAAPWDEPDKAIDVQATEVKQLSVEND